MSRRPLVVFAVLDAFPHRMVDRRRTPVLAGLAGEGGHAREGGRAVLSASTYPNHASFLTGAPPTVHGIYTSRAWRDGAFVPAQDVGPAVETLFERCRAAGRRAVAAVGDQNLIAVCGADAADAHWPPGGELSEDAPRGRLGYGADRGVEGATDALEPERADFFFLQLDEVDTERHLCGPDAPESLEQCERTDASFGRILERVRARWHETVVIAVSDHEHEAVDPGAVDLAAETRARGLDVAVDHDGTACVVVGDVSETELLTLSGVSEARALAPRHWLVWGEPGQQYGIDWGLAAQHGSPRTSAQLAVVGGGHPAARTLGARIERTRPAATDWAGWIGELLGLERPPGA